jgi:hypothetical protein
MPITGFEFDRVMVRLRDRLITCGVKHWSKAPIRLQAVSTVLSAALRGKVLS